MLNVGAAFSLKICGNADYAQSAAGVALTKYIIWLAGLRDDNRLWLWQLCAVLWRYCVMFIFATFYSATETFPGDLFRTRPDPTKLNENNYLFHRILFICTTSLLLPSLCVVYRYHHHQLLFISDFPAANLRFPSH